MPTTTTLVVRYRYEHKRERMARQHCAGTITSAHAGAGHSQHHHSACPACASRQERVMTSTMTETVTAYVRRTEPVIAALAHYTAELAALTKQGA